MVFVQVNNLSWRFARGKISLLGSKFVCDCKLLSCPHMEARVHLNIELKWYVGPSPRDSPDK